MKSHFPHLEPLILPYLVEHILVLVVGLDELVLADPPAEADDVRHLVLLLLQGLGDDLVRLVPVALLFPSESVSG